MTFEGPVEKVPKLDAAKRQLRTGIILFFEDADTVSVHTLTSAAQELLRDLLIDACITNGTVVLSHA